MNENIKDNLCIKNSDVCIHNLTLCDSLKLPYEYITLDMTIGNDYNIVTANGVSGGILTALNHIAETNGLIIDNNINNKENNDMNKTTFSDGAKTRVFEQPHFGYNHYTLALPNRIPYPLLPAISNVDVYKDKTTGEFCVTVVEFADGTTERAKCSSVDEYSLETGISICVTKKMFSMWSDGHGDSVYNKIIDKGLKVYRRNRKAEALAAKQEIERKEMIQRRIAKRKEKRERRAKAADERQIRNYVEALRRVKAEKSDKAKAEKKK